MKRILQTELLEKIRDDINAELEARQNIKKSPGTDVQQLKVAIALLNRWMDNPDQDLLLSDTDKFVRYNATATV